MRKKIIFLLIIFFSAWPQVGFLQEIIPDLEIDTEILVTESNNQEVVSVNKESDNSEKIFKARVIRILEERDLSRPAGATVRQQNVELVALSGEEAGQVFEFFGISDLDVVVSNNYRPGDRVFVMKSINADGQSVYYITDYIRSRGLWLLLIVFILALFAVGGFKGLRAIISLALSLLVILKILAPLVLQGVNPLLVGIPVSFLILMILIYLTEGWHRKSHIAIISIALALLATTALAVLFTYLTRLTGTGQEEVTYLIDAAGRAIDFRGLLLAAIIIGALGVLDDMAIGQIESVEQIKLANPSLNIKEIYRSALKIGQAHLGAITNTLFLAYAGAALPLILLFSLKQEPFLSFAQVINNEEIATEVVRTLVGVIGLCLVMPISTLLAVIFIKNKQSTKKT